MCLISHLRFMTSFYIRLEHTEMLLICHTKKKILKLNNFIHFFLNSFSILLWLLILFDSNLILKRENF